MFQATIDPVAGSVALSAAVGCIPLVTFFVCLVALKMKAHVSAIIALFISILVAIFGFNMPTDLTIYSAIEGAVYGLFPICLIIVAAVWFYNITVVSGRYKDLGRIFNIIGGGDVRMQALLIAFCFGALLESLAGFGAPIAITATMILGLGIKPIRAAMTVLLANTAPVAFGAVAVPIVTAGNMAPGAAGAAATSTHVAAIVGCQAPLFALVVPLLVMIILDGKQGLKDCWLPALVCGLSFGLAQHWCSNYFTYELTDIVASIVSMGVSVLFLHFWKGRGIEESRIRMGLYPVDTSHKSKLTPARVWMAVMPYLVIIVVFVLGKMVLPLTAFDIKVPWPGLTEIAADGTVVSLVLNAAGNNPGTIFNVTWLSNPGTMILVAGIIVTLIYHFFNDNGWFKLSFGAAFSELGKVCYRMRYSILTIACVLSLAYVMNFSGQTISIGQFLAGTGALFAFLSPVLGWVGTAVTGSDTSANALFSSLQAEAANANPALQHVSSDLFLAANTMGGVTGKMVSPQSLAIAASATYETESTLFKKLLPWSLGMLFVLCLLVFAQSHFLYFMIP